MKDGKSVSSANTVSQRLNIFVVTSYTRENGLYWFRYEEHYDTI